MTVDQPRLALATVVQAECWPSSITSEAFAGQMAAAVSHFVELDGKHHAAVAFSADAEVQALNARFRDQDKPTNVLSFPALQRAGRPLAAGDAPDSPVFLGDIILAFETIRDEARVQSVALEDHVAHLIIHGILHLLGYDHDDADAAEQMESLETDILATLNIENPYTEELIDAG